MKEIRPKINELELRLLLVAMRRANYDRVSGTPERKVYDRFVALSKGEHKKRRVH